MPRKCCVPGCKSNYDSELEYVTVYKFPNDPDMREKWKKCIPRKEWSPTKYSVVCRHHFLPCDMIYSNTFTDKSGVEHEVPKKTPTLKSDAYPSVFSELPSYFSNEIPQTCKAASNQASKIVILDCLCQNLLEQPLGNKKSHSLLPSKNIKLEPVFEVGQSNSTQLETILAVAQSNSIKLESVSETDGVHVSAKAVLPEIPVFDKISSKIPANIKTEPEDYIDYPAQGVHTPSENNPAISIQKHSQRELYSSIELVKQELPEDRRFNNMEDVTCIIQETEAHSNTESVLAKNSSLNRENCQVSENIFSVTESNVKLPVTDEDCQLQNVDTLVKQTPSSLKSLYGTAVYVNCSQQRVQARGAPYTSDVCDPVVSEETHERTHEALYTCDDYGTSFTVAQALKHHKRIHQGKQPYLCDDCGASYARAENLKTHKRRHTGEKPYKCDVCGASFVEAGYLKCHKRTHTGEKPYKCDGCGASFARTGDLKQHKRTHTGEKPYKCDKCGVSFARSGDLKRHKRRHTGEKHYKCDDCGASFAHAGQLIRHKRTHAAVVGQVLKCHKIMPTEEKPYQCDYCGASFAFGCYLKYHKRTHTGEKPYKCDECGATFAWTGDLKCHKRIHTGEKPFKCDDCGVSFARSGDLNCHKRRHTGEKPYKCDICDAYFIRSYYLKCHKRIHTGEKPYLCDYCGASFAQAGDLRCHKRTHTGENAYKSGESAVPFSHSSNVTSYKRSLTGE